MNNHETTVLKDAARKAAKYLSDKNIKVSHAVMLEAYAASFDEANWRVLRNKLEVQGTKQQNVAPTINLSSHDIVSMQELMRRIVNYYRNSRVYRDMIDVCHEIEKTSSIHPGLVAEIKSSSITSFTAAIVCLAEYMDDIIIGPVGNDVDAAEHYDAQRLPIDLVEYAQCIPKFFKALDKNLVTTEVTQASDDTIFFQNYQEQIIVEDSAVYLLTELTGFFDGSKLTKKVSEVNFSIAVVNAWCEHAKDAVNQVFHQTMDAALAEE